MFCENLIKTWSRTLDNDFSGSLSNGTHIVLQKPNGGYLANNTGWVQNISIGGYSSYWSKWTIEFSGSMTASWFRYGSIPYNQTKAVMMEVKIQLKEY